MEFRFFPVFFPEINPEIHCYRFYFNFLTFFQSTTGAALQKQPEALNVKLWQYQLNAISWMISIETQGETGKFFG